MNFEKLKLNVETFKLFLSALLTFYIYLSILNIKNRTLKKLLNCSIIAIITFIVIYFRYKTGYTMSIIVLIFLLSVYSSFIYKKELEKSVLVITISYSVNYVILFIAIFFTFLINKIIPIQSDIVNFIIITILELFIIIYLKKIKRIKHGISYLKSVTSNRYFDMIVLNVSVIIIFCLIIFEKGNENIILSKKMSVAFIIFSIIMFLTIKKSIEAYYKQKLLIQDLNETRKELEDKKKEIEELEAENLSFSKKSHSLAHKQKSLEFKINKLLMNSENADELGLQEDLKKISQQLNENSKLPKLDKTGITEVDDMLNVMQEECRLNDIDFILQLNGNIYQMTNNYISKEDLAILLADHIKDAIIAINHSDNVNKSIMVRLGKIEECFAVYIYDSGIEFPKKVLEKLGKIPITTYPDEGGTGMGFMNTFDLLKKSNASLIIESVGKLSKDNYTKVIKIKFDNKNQIYV